MIRIWSEMEDSEPYSITLWWKLDGLRINHDGTTQWISRKIKPCNGIVNNPVNYSLATQCTASLNPIMSNVYANTPPIAAMQYEIMRMNIASQIALQNQSILCGLNQMQNQIWRAY